MDPNPDSTGPMSLERQLEEMNKKYQQAQEELAKSEESRVQAEEGRVQAEEGRVQAEERLAKAEEKTRTTSFEEVLQACHELACLMTVETNKKKTTKGSTTKPDNKPCPTELKRWTDFPNIRQDRFDEFRNLLHPIRETTPKLFNSRGFIQELGQLVVKRQRIGSEAALRVYHSVAVEAFVTEIVSKLIEHPQYGQRLQLGQGMSFESHTNTLSVLDEEVQAHLPPSMKSSKPYHPQNPTSADQICVSHTTADKSELSYVIEYKAPHKFTPPILRVGLRDMNLKEEVISRAEIPTERHEKFEYHADRLVAAAMTQTYGYMIESGLEYSCIITGEAIVFLWIREEEPNTLYYHLAEPKEEVMTADVFQYSLTAVSQLLSFSLLAMRSTRRCQQWRNASIAGAQTWTVDWKEMLRGIPSDENISPPPSGRKPRKYETVDRSPYPLRSKASCKPNKTSTSDNRDDPAGDSDDGPEDMPTPSKKKEPRASLKRGGERRRGQQQDTSSGKQQHRQYCTHRCLLGLARRSALDRRCPNVGLHRQGRKGRTHLLDKQQFADLVQRQLATDLDDNVTELHKQGIRGALFQISLVSHGYVVVAKATCEVYIPYLQHEGRIYDQLEILQGNTIPVYLGNINLERPWLDLHVRLTHMLLMSWAGEERAKEVEGKEDLRAHIKAFQARIQRLGILHDDLHANNILWNDHLQRPMFIDFEGATEVAREALQEVSTNRKRKQSLEKEDKAAGDSARRPCLDLVMR